MKVPIKRAIDSQSWYHCQMKYEDYDEDYDPDQDQAPWEDKKTVDYRIRVLSFEKIDLNEVDRKEDMELNLLCGILWKIEVEILNLWRKQIGAFNIIDDSVILVDQGGTEFKPIDDMHLTGGSDYAKSSRLFSMAHSGMLIPKVPFQGAMAFFLPPDESARYYLSVKGGTMWEERDEGEKEEAEALGQGWVYILDNPSMAPDLLKIGMTARTPEERIRELSSGTGVPMPFRIVFQARVCDCKQVETLAHQKLAKYRHTSSKEFFNLPQSEAISIVQAIASQFPVITPPSPSPEEIAKEERIREIEARIEDLREELETLKD